MRPTEEELRMISRLLKTQDGKDFVCFINRTYLETYEELIKIDKDQRDMLIGEARALKKQLNLFDEVDNKLRAFLHVDAPDWT